MFAVESRLNDAALPQPRRAFVSQQALAKNPAGVAHHMVFQEVLILGHQWLIKEAGLFRK